MTAIALPRLLPSINRLSIVEVCFNSRRQPQSTILHAVMKPASIPLICIGLVLAAAMHCGGAPGADPMNIKFDEAADSGLAYLARQQHDDGSFDTDLKDPAAEPLKPKLANTALSLLAFLAQGHVPDIGRYGLAVRGAMDFLVSRVPDDGYIGNVDGSRMYGQAIVTLALSEAYGVETAADKRRQEQAALRKLVAVILKAQDVSKSEPWAGGWRYEPNAVDSDISLSGWNALALRAAQEIGLAVPGESLRRAAAFVSRCYDSDSGTFAYQPGGDRRLGATATGVLAIYLLDAKQEDLAKAAKAARSLVEHPIDEQNAYPFYSIYYVTHAAFAAGDDTWEAVSKVTLARVVKCQSSDGSWMTLSEANKSNTSEPGKVYRTAMAVLTLAVPQRLLPIYQK
jgi:hypothetical protein